jgi:hypothetical protein
MANPSALRANYADLYGSSMLPVLEELFRSDYEARPMIRDMIFKTVSHDRDIWQYSETHDMPLFSQVTEGQDYTFSAPKAGSHKTITVNKYGLGFSISEEAVDDGKFEMIGDAVKKMAKSAHESQEQAAMNVINNGFSTQTTADGVSLFNASHTLPSGGTFRNTLAVNADISYTALQTAIQDFMKVFKGDSGIIETIRPQYLLVPNELRMYARELCESEAKPDTADNNKNTVKDEGLTMLSSPRLTDTVFWGLFAAPSDAGLRLINRKSLETKSAAPDTVGFLNDAIYYKARYREALDAVHGYGTFGVQGV